VRARAGARRRGRLLRGRARAVRGRARRQRGRLQRLQRGLHRRLLLVLLALGPAARRGPAVAPRAQAAAFRDLPTAYCAARRTRRPPGEQRCHPSITIRQKKIPCVVPDQAGAEADGCSLSPGAGRRAARL